MDIYGVVWVYVGRIHMYVCVVSGYKCDMYVYMYVCMCVCVCVVCTCRRGL